MTWNERIKMMMMLRVRERKEKIHINMYTRFPRKPLLPTRLPDIFRWAL